ncbi:hypothetical protein NMG60_11020912 [Bertholletia excelsa]
MKVERKRTSDVEAVQLSRNYAKLSPSESYSVLHSLIASPSTSNPGAASIQSRESKRKGRGTSTIGTKNHGEEIEIRKNGWRTVAAHHSYSLKLIEALRRTRRTNSSSPAAFRTIRRTADRVLAVAGKGRTRWSRALVASRLRMRLVHKKVKGTGNGNANGRSKKLAERKTLPPLARKMRILGRLVPGCQKLSPSNLLEETADYIAALEMQVRAMTVLAGLLDAAESGDNPTNRPGSGLS